MSSEWLTLLSGVAAFLVGLSKGGLPMIGMLAVPLMALVMPPLQAAMLLLPIYVASDLVGIWLYRHAFSRTHLRVLPLRSQARVAPQPAPHDKRYR